MDLASLEQALNDAGIPRSFSRRAVKSVKVMVDDDPTWFVKRAAPQEDYFLITLWRYLRDGEPSKGLTEKATGRPIANEFVQVWY